MNSIRAFQGVDARQILKCFMFSLSCMVCIEDMRSLEIRTPLRLVSRGAMLQGCAAHPAFHAAQDMSACTLQNARMHIQ